MRVNVSTHMKRLNRRLVSCTSFLARFCFGFHSTALPAMNRPSSQFHKCFGGGGMPGAGKFERV